MKQTAQCIFAVVFTTLAAHNYSVGVNEGDLKQIPWVIVAVALATLFLREAVRSQ